MNPSDVEPLLDLPPVPEDPDQWPEVALAPSIALCRRALFEVVVSQAAIDDVAAHGDAHPDREVCGVLVGDVGRDRAGPLLKIDAVVRGETATGGMAQVTFTGETWTQIHEDMHRHHPTKRIVGWYHTHPGHGIFLSEMDLFIQRHFFGMPWQVAYVYDPHAQEHGMFVWRDGEIRREEALVEPRRTTLFSPSATSTPAADAAAAAAPRPLAEAVAPRKAAAPPLPAMASTDHDPLPYWLVAIIFFATAAIGGYLMWAPPTDPMPPPRPTTKPAITAPATHPSTRPARPRRPRTGTTRRVAPPLPPAAVPFTKPNPTTLPWNPWR